MQLHGGAQQSAILGNLCSLDSFLFYFFFPSFLYFFFPSSSLPNLSPSAPWSPCHNGFRLNETPPARRTLFHAPFVIKPPLVVARFVSDFIKMKRPSLLNIRTGTFEPLRLTGTFSNFSRHSSDIGYARNGIATDR